MITFFGNKNGQRRAVADDRQSVPVLLQEVQVHEVVAVGVAVRLARVRKNVSPLQTDLAPATKPSNVVQDVADGRL